MACAKPASVEDSSRPPTLEQRLRDAEVRAAESDRDQALDRLHLASLALAAGDPELAERALRPAVLSMQDFRADGQFAAVLGAERQKEWKGEPYEKMAAFWMLGTLLHANGDHGNALAMGKSALLADTGTRLERFQADFVPAYVLKAAAFQALGETHNAERAIDEAIHAWTTRRMIAELTSQLEPIEQKSTERAVHAAKALLLSGLPAGVDKHPRDPVAAINGALAHATALRQVSLQSKRAERPVELRSLSRRELTQAFEELGRLTKKWESRASALPPDLLADVDTDSAALRALQEDPSLLLFITRGRGPEKVNAGRYGEILRLVPRRPAPSPTVNLDGQAIRPQLLDSISWQATTRGGRAVDGFLGGKAVFKDASVGIGYSLMVAGDVANATDVPELAAVAYIAGALTWIAGALTNPEADTRAWTEIPDEIYLVAADPTPGTHTLTIDGRRYTVDIPDDDTIVHLVPNLQPWGADAFGAPCTACEAPLAIPSGGKP